MTYGASKENVDVRGYTFTCRTAGNRNGEPVLLLHGFPETSASWLSAMAILKDQGFFLVAPDQRGYSPGARPLEIEAYTMDELSMDAFAIADHYGFETFHLVGHDWGGGIAWMMALKHPERLKTLNVVSTPHPLALLQAYTSGTSDQGEKSSYMQFFQQESVPEEMLLANHGDGLRMMFKLSGLDTEKKEYQSQLSEYIDTLLEPHAMTCALNWYRAMGKSDMSFLGPVEMPTLYIWSTEDVALGREAAEATENFVKGPYQFEVLDGLSHWIPEEAPEIMANLLGQHMKVS
ncbi:MAG: alpha/beta hydrolase [Acidimicrobiales bacterium]|nr:alpha/beta hydrolase [Acidimicrobiales bacterium]